MWIIMNNNDSHFIELDWETYNVKKHHGAEGETAQ